MFSFTKYLAMQMLLGVFSLRIQPIMQLLVFSTQPPNYRVCG